MGWGRGTRTLAPATLGSPVLGRSTQFLAREALGSRLRIARTIGAQGGGEGAQRFWTSVGLGERDRVQLEGFVLGARGHEGPGGVSANGELPGPSTGRACSGAPGPRGNPPVQSARATGHGQAKDFRAPRTADGGCRGPKVNLLWQRPATRSLHWLCEAWLNEYAPTMQRFPGSAA